MVVVEGNVEWMVVVEGNVEWRVVVEVECGVEGCCGGSWRWNVGWRVVVDGVDRSGAFTPPTASARKLRAPSTVATMARKRAYGAKRRGPRANNARTANDPRAPYYFVFLRRQLS